MQSQDNPAVRVVDTGATNRTRAVVAQAQTAASSAHRVYHPSTQLLSRADMLALNGGHLLRAKVCVCLGQAPLKTPERYCQRTGLQVGWARIVILASVQ